jgi:hypothetical protein
VYHLISSHRDLPESTLWHALKQSLKSSGDKAFPCFKPFLVGNMSDKCLPTWTFIDTFLLALPVSWGYQNQ